MRIDSQHHYPATTEPANAKVGSSPGTHAEGDRDPMKRDISSSTVFKNISSSPVSLSYPPLDSRSAEIMAQIRAGKLFMVDRNRRNGLIIYKQFHAEFAGPGSAVGGTLDQDCTHIVLVGNISLIYPETVEERKNAYLIRRQWIMLTRALTEEALPAKRAQRIINQFENYFDLDTLTHLPDEAFALLVGVLPYTVNQVRKA